MKKLLMVLTLALSFVFVASAIQAQVEPGITGAGIKAGGNMENVTGDDIAENDFQFGFTGGGFATFTVNEYFGVQPEVLFVMKGTKGDALVVDPDGQNIVVTDGKVKLTYIQIPVLAKVTFPTDGMVKPNIFVGPAVGFNMTAKVEGIADEGGPDEITLDHDIENIKSVSFGVVFGGGVSFMMQNKGAITVDVRYDLGLTDMLDDPSEDVDPETQDKVNLTKADDTPFDWKTSTISLMVGYSFL
jgi:hypothetical protein